MFSLYDRISSLCSRDGIKITELAQNIGLYGSMFSDLKHGRKSSLSIECLVKIADYFNITLDELVGRKKEAPDAETSETMDKVIDLFGQMTEGQQELFVQLAEQFLLQSSK